MQQGEALQGKAKPALFAISCVAEQNFTNIILEGDALNVFGALNLNQICCWKLSIVNRNANLAVHNWA